jgi:hypothetical protein
MFLVLPFIEISEEREKSKEITKDYNDLTYYVKKKLEYEKIRALKSIAYTFGETPELYKIIYKNEQITKNKLKNINFNIKTNLYQIDPNYKKWFDIYKTKKLQ